jgi:hypothetical protein
MPGDRVGDACANVRRICDARKSRRGPGRSRSNSVDARFRAHGLTSPDLWSPVPWSMLGRSARKISAGEPDRWKGGNASMAEDTGTAGR